MKRIVVLQAALAAGLVWCSGVGAQGKASRAAADSSEIYAASFSPDGRRIVTGSDQGTVSVWDARTGKLLRAMPVPGRKAGVYGVRIHVVKFSPDGRRVAIGSFDRALRLWDVRTGKLLRDFKGHTASVHALSFSPDGKQIASGSGTAEDGSLNLWSVSSGKLLRQLGTKQETLAVQFSPNGRHIVSGGWGHAARATGIWVWNAKTGKLLRRIASATGVSALSLSRNGRQVVSNYSDPVDYSGQATTEPTSGFKVWDLATGKLLRAVQIKSGAYDVALAPDGQRIVSCGWDVTGRHNGVRLWNAATGKQVRALTGEEDYPRFVSFSPNGRQVLSGGADRKFYLWNAATGQKLRTFN